MPVQRIVGGVEIEDNLLGRRAMRLQEQFDKQRLDRRRVMADLMIARRTGPRSSRPFSVICRRRRAIAPPRGKLAQKNRHQRIVAKCVVVVEVLIAQRQAKNPLADERRQAMLDQIAAPAILKASGEALNQPDRPIGCYKQKVRPRPR